jgi:hypothetical protein
MDKYLRLADEYGNNLEDMENMEDFARFRGLVRATAVSATPVKQGYTGVPGDLPSGTFVGNIGISAKRTLVLGEPIQRNLPVILGVSFAFSDYYNFLSKRVSGFNVDVFPNYLQNSIQFSFTDSRSTEIIEISGGSNYNIFSFLQGLYNIRAIANKVRVSLPFEENSRLNQWQRDGLAALKQSWLSNIEKQPITMSRAPGQFNKSIYDSNIPVVLSNTEGIAVFIPPLPYDSQVNTSETTDITIYFSKLEKI